MATAILPSYPLSASSSISEPKFSETDGDALSYNKELEGSPDTPAEVVRPTWQRVVTGGAREGFQTKRALGSRHIMMIGASVLSLMFQPGWLTGRVVAIGGTIGTGIFLSAGSVRLLSLSHFYSVRVHVPRSVPCAFGRTR